MALKGMPTGAPILTTIMNFKHYFFIINLIRM